MIKIIKIDSNYLEEVYRLCKSDFGKESWFSKSFLRETLNYSGFFYGAFNKNKLVGLILVKKFDRPKLWIFLFLVDKEYRRMGIGTRLLHSVERHCSREYPLLFVDFTSSDKSAMKFYKKSGFNKQARSKDWFGINEAGLIYAKKVRTT